MDENEYTIYGRYKGGKREVVDTATDYKDAEYLLAEYRLAFGKDWVLWVDGGLVNIE